MDRVCDQVDYQRIRTSSSRQHGSFAVRNRRDEGYLHGEVTLIDRRGQNRDPESANITE